LFQIDALSLDDFDRFNECVSQMILGMRCNSLENLRL